MSFGMTSMTTETGSNGHTGALFEGLSVPADSTAALKRSTPKGAPRVQSAVRNQVELRACDLDAALPADHPARAVWAFVQSMDLQGLYAQIRAVEGSVGRAPIDPAILMSLWLYATLDGVGPARELDRLCDSDDACRWLCGGVGVNHHTLGDFRVEHPQWLDGQLTRSVAGLLSQGLVRMNRVAHDGMRVRAHAGAASFRRRETLEQLMQDAQAQVQALKDEGFEHRVRGLRRPGKRRCARPLRPTMPSFNAGSPQKTNFQSNRLVTLIRRAGASRCVEFIAEIQTFTGSQLPGSCLGAVLAELRDSRIGGLA
ncbi:MAG: hypothetical protein NVS1B6_18030 [Steroidobacteraceae bacterium]